MSNSLSSSKKPATPLTLTLRECGPVVSFKNSKMLARGRLITNPKYQAVMDCITGAIESEFVSLYQTSTTETGTVCSLHSWIVSCAPLDDSRKWIPEFSVSIEECAPGQDGADLTIERID